MSKRVNYLYESPCYQCGFQYECGKKIENNPTLGYIKDGIFGNADFDFHVCGIWIALNVSEMIQVLDE